MALSAGATDSHGRRSILACPDGAIAVGRSAGRGRHPAGRPTYVRAEPNERRTQPVSAPEICHRVGDGSSRPMQAFRPSGGVSLPLRQVRGRRARPSNAWPRAYARACTFVPLRPLCSGTARRRSGSSRGSAAFDRACFLAGRVIDVALDGRRGAAEPGDLGDRRRGSGGRGVRRRDPERIGMRQPSVGPYGARATEPRARRAHAAS